MDDVAIAIAMLGTPLRLEDGTVVYKRNDGVFPFLDTDARIMWTLTTDSLTYRLIPAIAKSRAAVVLGMYGFANAWEDDLGERDPSKDAEGGVFSSGRHIITHRVYVTSMPEKMYDVLRMDNQTVYPMRLFGVPVKRIPPPGFYE